MYDCDTDCCYPESCNTAVSVKTPHWPSNKEISFYSVRFFVQLTPLDPHKEAGRKMSLTELHKKSKMWTICTGWGFYRLFSWWQASWSNSWGDIPSKEHRANMPSLWLERLQHLLAHGSSRAKHKAKEKFTSWLAANLGTNITVW